jgi:tetratricopeptide (TPR) repeat protein
VISRHSSQLLALVALASAVVWSQDAAKQPQYKDRAEYDLVDAFQKETDPAKALAHLNAWKQKYPETDFKELRASAYLDTYRKLNQGENMLRAGQEWLSINPKATSPLYWITLLTFSLQNTAPDRLDLGEKAARGFLANLETEMAPEKKPAQVSEADFAKQRLAFTSAAMKTLAWIEMSRKNWVKAEEECVKFLKLNPNSGVVSSWLANSMVYQKTPEKQEQAMFHLARAGWYTGEDALDATVKKQIQDFLTKTYKSFHGGEDGMKEMIQIALKSPFPPNDFDIESAAEVKGKQEKALAESNPLLATWLRLKETLTGAGGAEYFEAMKGAAFPEKLKGRVVAQTPARRPKEVTLALSQDHTGEEVKLILDEPMAAPAPPGTEIEFVKGVGQAFTREPLLLTFEIEKANITGWPAPAPAGKKTGGKKK